DDGHEKTAALSAIFLGDRDAHQAKLEKLLYKIGGKFAGFVHLGGERANLLLREFAHRLAKERLLICDRSQRADGPLRRCWTRTCHLNLPPKLKASTEQQCNTRVGSNATMHALRCRLRKILLGCALTSCW